MKKILYLTGALFIVAFLAVTLPDLLLQSTFYTPSPQSFQSTSTPTPTPQSPQSYISCSCGCYPFDKPLEEIAKKQCLYRSQGDSIEDKIKQDQQLTEQDCAAVGCSYPIKYQYCD